MAGCRGVLAAQVVKPQARVLAEARGHRWVEVDLAELRGEREPALTLFASFPGMSRRGPCSPSADGGVLLITLNRPEARNAVNAAVAERRRRRARPPRRRRRAAASASSPAPARASAPAWT